MSDSGAGGCFGILMLIGTIASWLGSGYLAWDWIDPNGFGTAILFLIAWGILGKVFDFVIGLVIMGVISLFN